jgi:hypothetical protein
VTVFNAADDTIIVSVDRDYVWQDEAVKIEVGTHRTFRAGDLRGIVAKNGCTYAYDLVIPAAAFRGTDGVVQIQVQPDLSLVLLPRGSRMVAPSDEVARRQGEGFPIRPTSSRCS